VILAVLILALIGGVCIALGAVDDSPGAIIWGVALVIIAAVLTGRGL
jgi:hypothetical protein